jgi:putative CocE/NonD family hydrolase
MSAIGATYEPAKEGLLVYATRWASQCIAIVIDMNSYWLRWFDYWLKGIDNGLMKEPPVRIFVMGENAWTNEDEWPMARTRWTKYYLHSNGHANTLSGDGTLSTTEPANEPTDSYTYDPAQPVPFITDARPDDADAGGRAENLSRSRAPLVYRLASRAAKALTSSSQTSSP